MDGCWDATDWFPLSGANAAGDIVATPRDLMRWMDALFAGRVLDDARLHEMAGNVKEASFPGAPITANGHGILVSTIDELEIKGHIGQLPGHTTCTGPPRGLRRECDALPELRGGRLRILLPDGYPHPLRRVLPRRGGGVEGAGPPS